MKTLLILILLAALGGAMAFTRPTEADFKGYLLSKAAQGSEREIVAFIGGTQFNNRILWISVEQDGKTLYIGALSHWFAREDFPSKWEIQKAPKFPS